MKLTEKIKIKSYECSLIFSYLNELLKQKLAKTYDLLKRKNKDKIKKFWIKKFVMSLYDPPTVQAAFRKTEIRRKGFIFKSPWDKWKIFIDGQFICYIYSGETKIIEKQGLIFIDMGWFNEDGTYKKWARRIYNRNGIDQKPTSENSVGTRFDLEYFECSVNWWKFFKMSLSGDWDNYGRLRYMHKEKEYSLHR